jgi:hypothetical protein
MLYVCTKLYMSSSNGSRVIITAMKPESNDSFCEYWQLVQMLKWGEEGHRQCGDHIIIVLYHLGKTNYKYVCEIYNKCLK